MHFLKVIEVVNIDSMCYLASIILQVPKRFEYIENRNKKNEVIKNKSANGIQQIKYYFN